MNLVFTVLMEELDRVKEKESGRLRKWRDRDVVGAFRAVVTRLIVVESIWQRCGRRYE